MKNVMKTMIVLQVLVLLGLPECGYGESDTNPVLAKPLVNGIVFDGDLSIAVAAIKRDSNSATVWLAFRKLSEERPVSRVSRRASPQRAFIHHRFTLRTIDDRENKYESSYFDVGKGRTLKGQPPDLGRLPRGFTWVDTINIGIPAIAPIIKIEILQFRGATDDWFRLEIPDYFQFPGQGFDIKELKNEGKLISSSDELQIDKNLSVRFQELGVKDEFLNRYGGKEKGLSITLPIIVKNADYNPHTVNPYRLCVQFSNGIFFDPTKQRWRTNGHDIAALSSQTIVTTADIKGHADIQLLMLYTWEHRFVGFIEIPSEIEKEVSKANRNCSLYEDAKAKLEKWARENLKVVIKHGFGIRDKRVIEFDDFAVVENHIWATGYLHGYGGRGHLVYSPDGGNTWEIQWKSDKTETEPRQVKFINKNEGMFVTTSGAFKTLDGGKTWQKTD